MPSWLSKQVGPFPVGAWVLIIGAGLALGWFVNRRMGFGDEPPTLVPDTGRDTSAAGTGAAQPRSVGPTRLSPAPPDPGTGQPIPTTNDEWVAMATRALSSPEGPTALAVFEALTAWVRGEPITAEQRQIVNRALARFGAPPYSPHELPGEVPAAPEPRPTAPAPSQPLVAAVNERYTDRTGWSISGPHPADQQQYVADVSAAIHTEEAAKYAAAGRHELADLHRQMAAASTPAERARLSALILRARYAN